MENTAKPLVLVAEDDAFDAKVYKIKLEEEGYKVITVTSGSNVVQTAKDTKPDLIILDLIMPGKDGFEILQELKTDPILQKIKVLVISSLSQNEDIKKVQSLGADGYFTKTTVSMHDICQKVKALLS